MDFSYIDYSWIKYWFHYVSSILVVSVTFSLSSFFVVILYNKLKRITYIEQIYTELNSKTSEVGKISTMKYIHSYFQNYSFEELLLFNLKYKRFQFRHYYYFICLVTFILSFIATIYKSYLIASLTIISPIIIVLLPLSIVGIRNNNFKNRGNNNF